MKRKIDVRCRI